MPIEATPVLERWLKIGGIAITLAGVLIGAYQFARTQSVSAARPFLEQKLKWCEEAVEIAAGIAVYGRGSTLQAKGDLPAVRRVDRFWVLYWGVMGMVENDDVVKAMIAYGNALKTDVSSSDSDLALKIAHACRNEMARDWSPIWSR